MLEWDLSRRDWVERIRAGRSLLPDLPFTQAQKTRADHAVAVFDCLKLADVPGTPTMAEACGDWFRDIVRAIHGSWDEAAQQRMVQEVFLLVPKKNSKTSYAALFMLATLLLNERPRAKFILVAPTQDITEMAFAQATGAIRLSPALLERVHVQDHLKKLTDRKTGAHVEIMTFDPKVLTGQKHNGCLIDELHLLGNLPRAIGAIGQLRGGMIAYPESFLIFTTTQSERAPVGVFKAELGKARRIRDGAAKGRTLPLLYELPPDIQRGGRRGEEPWRDPKYWAMVTPNAGRSITLERLQRDFEEAKTLGEDETMRWASQHLNVEMGTTSGSDVWAGAEYWDQNAEPGLTLDAIKARCDVVMVGVDGGGLDDLFGLAVLGRDKVSRVWLLWVRAWAHIGVLERRKSEAARLRDFEADGDLVVVDRFEDAFEEVADIVEDLHEAGILGQVGLDPYGVDIVVDDLKRRGIGDERDEGRVVGVSQGYKLTGTVKIAEVRLSDGTLKHAGQPIMEWCVGNARIEPRGNAVVVTKAASGTSKIDPLMAAFNAVNLMNSNPEPAGSVYTGERGLSVFG